MTERQYRRRYHAGIRGDWSNLGEVDHYINLGRHEAFGDVIGLELRDKPIFAFAPGFYQMSSKPHTVRHFEELAPGYSMDDFLRTWRPVDVVPRGEE